MGPKSGYDWCTKHHVAAMFQERDALAEDGLKIVTTPRFDELAPQVPAPGRRGPD
jgi:hypothetical protein